MSMYTVTQTLLLAFIIFAIKSLNKNSLSGSKKWEANCDRICENRFYLHIKFYEFKVIY